MSGTCLPENMKKHTGKHMWRITCVGIRRTGIIKSIHGPSDRMENIRSNRNRFNLKGSNMFNTLPRDPHDFLQWNWAQLSPYADELIRTKPYQMPLYPSGSWIGQT